jgi:addiction module HigA family antidote
MTKSGDDEVFDYPTCVVLPPVHPGHTLARELDARGLSANALALKLRVPANRLTEILRGQRAISAETALRPGRYFGTGAVFWMTLQGNNDLALAKQELGDRINQEIDAA